MNDKARKILCTIVTQHGHDLWEDPRRVESILRDLCGAYPAEIAALVGAARQRVPQDLTASSDGLPWAAASVRYVQQLTQQMALSDEAARWAVDSWALALGRISEHDTVRQAQTLQNIPRQDVLISPNPPTPYRPIAAEQTYGGALTVSCNSCQSRIRVPAAAAGKKGKCPRCGVIMAIPGVPEPPRAFSPPPPTTPEPRRRTRPQRREDDEDEENDDDDHRDLRRRRTTEDTRLSLAAMIVGIVGAVFGVTTPCCWPISGPIAGICGIAALVLGVLGLKRGGRAYAITGIILGAIVLLLAVMWLALMVFVIAVDPGRRKI